MKREGNLIGRIAEPDNLREAYRKAARGKAAKTDVVLFGRDLDMNLRKLRMQVLSGMVDVGNYTYFQIRDPKPRRICAAAFPERVLHHALMNVCHPDFERQLVETTYATRPGKGLYQALNRTRQAALKYRYVAKFDFRKYFDSIDHAVLERKLHRIFKDAALLKIFHRIIDSYQVAPGKGLPIGNLTSQYYANFYLSSMDHRIKEISRAPEYVRYMDDFLIFHSRFLALDGTGILESYSAASGFCPICLYERTEKKYIEKRSTDQPGPTACCAAVTGTTTRGTAACRIVTTTTPTTETTTTASALYSSLLSSLLREMEVCVLNRSVKRVCVRQTKRSDLESPDIQVPVGERSSLESSCMLFKTQRVCALEEGAYASPAT